MQWIMVWTNHSQIIKLISTEKPGCPATSSFKSRKPPQMGFHIIVNYLLRGTEGWDKERSACNFLDQHLRLGSWSDVMWCTAHERNCWLSYFRNQKPKTPIPCLQSQPDSVKLPFNRQRPHAWQTGSSHYHDCLPLSRLPLGILRKPVLLLTTPPSLI